MTSKKTYASKRNGERYRVKGADRSSDVETTSCSSSSLSESHQSSEELGTDVEETKGTIEPYMHEPLARESSVAVDIGGVLLIVLR